MNKKNFEREMIAGGNFQCTLNNLLKKTVK